MALQSHNVDDGHAHQVANRYNGRQQRAQDRHDDHDEHQVAGELKRERNFGKDGALCRDGPANQQTDRALSAGPGPTEPRE